MTIPIINIYLNPVWILLFAEIVGLIALFAYHLKKHDMPSVVGVFLDLIGIAITIYQMYPHDIPDTYISQASPIEYHGSAFNEGWYYGGWRDGMPQGSGHLDYDFFLTVNTIQYT